MNAGRRTKAVISKGNRWIRKCQGSHLRRSVLRVRRQCFDGNQSFYRLLETLRQARLELQNLLLDPNPLWRQIYHGRRSGPYIHKVQTVPSQFGMGILRSLVSFEKVVVHEKGRIVGTKTSVDQWSNLITGINLLRREIKGCSRGRSRSLADIATKAFRTLKTTYKDRSMIISSSGIVIFAYNSTTRG